MYFHPLLRLTYYFYILALPPPKPFVPHGNKSSTEKVCSKLSEFLERSWGGATLQQKEISKRKIKPSQGCSQTK